MPDAHPSVAAVTRTPRMVRNEEPHVAAMMSTGDDVGRSRRPARRGAGPLVVGPWAAHSRAGRRQARSATAARRAAAPTAPAAASRSIANRGSTWPPAGRRAGPGSTQRTLIMAAGARNEPIRARGGTIRSKGGPMWRCHHHRQWLSGGRVLGLVLLPVAAVPIHPSRGAAVRQPSQAGDAAQRATVF